jgi:RimJ/RimL family protein N-acetyltransferase
MEISATTPAELGWLQLRIGAAFTPDARGVKVTDRTGRIRGMVAFDGWTRYSCFAHIALETPVAGRRLAKTAFTYAFQSRGLMLGLIRATNERSRTLAERLGFRMVHRILDGHAKGVDLLLMELRRDDCRWLKEDDDARTV